MLFLTTAPLHPRPIIDIIDLSSECVLIVLPEENDECFDDYTVQTTTESSITVANTSVANVTICGLNLCNDTLGFRGRSNGDDLNSVESPTSTESELPKILNSVACGVNSSGRGALGMLPLKSFRYCGVPCYQPGS